MRVGIAGLGLIGGSLAKAYKKAGGYEVLAYDIQVSVQEIAMVAGACDDVLMMDNAGSCDLILIALYPQAAIDYLSAVAPRLGPHTLVIDCCGTKQAICKAGFVLADQYGFTFVGGHPMAGTHHWGFAFSRAELFQGAGMVIVPKTYDDINLLERIQTALAPAGFGRISVTTASEHDRLIAFTSQLAHVVSNAYIKSPTAQAHKGLSAGSYKDLTRVAWLNPDMWTPLFIENKAHLGQELDWLIDELSSYRDALMASDAPRLRELLEDGRKRKEEIDGKG